MEQSAPQMDPVLDPQEESVETQIMIGQFIVNLDGYEGPIDMLLAMAREQKFDLTQISILALANQYLAFVEEAGRQRLELAADYLVMAAWLAYLKSRMLLPEEPEDEPSALDMAEALAFQLQRLEAMQNAGRDLFEGPQLNKDFYGRGMTEKLVTISEHTYEVDLYDLLAAYGAVYQRKETRTFDITPTHLFSVEDAIIRLRHILGNIPSWSTLKDFIPIARHKDPIIRKSAVAATFVATLELAKNGVIEIKQESNFGDIQLRAVHTETETA